MHIKQNAGSCVWRTEAQRILFELRVKFNEDRQMYWSCFYMQKYQFSMQQIGISSVKDAKYHTSYIEKYLIHTHTQEYIWTHTNIFGYKKNSPLTALIDTVLEARKKQCGKDGAKRIARRG